MVVKKGLLKVAMMVAMTVVLMALLMGNSEAGKRAEWLDVLLAASLDEHWESRTASTREDNLVDLLVATMAFEKVAS